MLFFDIYKSNSDLISTHVYVVFMHVCLVSNTSIAPAAHRQCINISSNTYTPSINNKHAHTHKHTHTNACIHFHTFLYFHVAQMYSHLILGEEEPAAQSSPSTLQLRWQPLASILAVIVSSSTGSLSLTTTYVCVNV